MHSLGRQVERFLSDFDVLLTPTMATPPLRIGDLSLAHPNPAVSVKNLLKTTAFTQLFNASGNPAASVPTYWSADGLPIGVQLVARYGDESTLFRLAAQIEAARPWAGKRAEGFGNSILSRRRSGT
jgi:Asp-tRNA(Asn)/Glu-tRNA(Gln) amidotransferase A subunit family amidase